MRRLLACLSLILLLISCKKDTVKMPILGKWKMVEAYEGGTSGCFCWHQVSPTNADQIEFKANGEYRIEMPPVSSLLPCPGRYRLINDTTIGLRAECLGSFPGPEAIGTYSQSTRQLTIEYEFPASGRVIRNRYIKLWL